ncbi:MAG: dihydrodipicolinate reductase [Planctomycetota bacterium]
MATIRIMVNGLPGNMASEVVKAAREDGGFELVPFALTGPEITAASAEAGGVTFQLVRPDKRDETLTRLTREFPGFITIDYSHPTAVNGNAEFYCRHGLPFVMGTTGGDRPALEKTVAGSRTAAVIAPNMAKQIVGVQMMLEHAAANFPGLFKGYTMRLEESHQAGKADTSGTARAMVGYFNKMGVPFKAADITMVRDPRVQKETWGVPDACLKGHAYHTYTLTSADGSVDVQIEHNVRGRRVYALGTLDAVRFLHGKVATGAAGVFTMLDVLRAGMA